MSRFIAALIFGVGLYGQTLPDLTVAGISTANVTTDTQSLQVSGTLAVTVRNLGGALATPFRVVAWEDRDGNGVLNAVGDVTLGSAGWTGTLGTGADAVVVVPVGGGVLFRGNRIFVMVDSGSSVGEGNEGNNIANTAAINAVRPSVNAFQPTLKWSWTSSSTLPNALNVMNTPAVADLNKDGIPDVVFGATDSLGGGNTEIGYLRALSGRDGKELFTVTETAPNDLRITTSGSLAIGDIDNDGMVEILATDSSGSRVIAFENDGTFKWRSAALEAPTEWGAIAIADLDGDGTPEIIIGRQVLTAAGAIRWSGTGTRGANLGPISYAADIDLDGKLEVVAGPTAYSTNGSIKYQNTGILDGYTAIGNFDSDPEAEIVLVGSGVVYLLDHDMKVKWGPISNPGGGGGPPTVADFDGDGQPEIGIAGSVLYVVFETDGKVKWTAPIRDGSNRTGSSVFDFNGDGVAEVVYRDEVSLFVFQGTDGSVLFKTPLSSCTWSEYPLVADVDGNGKADLLVTANQNCGYGSQRGIFIFSDDANTVTTRKIWNQHAYSITNVNDDGTIPRNPTANWQVTGLNNFRLNTFAQPVAVGAAPDYTSSLIRKNDAAFPASVRLTARVGNGGAVAAAQSNPCPAVAPAGLTLTAEGKARGFCLSVFADNFPNASGIGPLGLAFPNTGGVLVSDYPGNVRRFPTNADGQRATNFPTQQYGLRNALDLIKADGIIYMADQGRGRLLRLNDDGSLHSVIHDKLPGATGLAVNPFNGHLFVSSVSSGALWDVDLKTGKETVFANISADGISIAPDGSVLYAAATNRILGYRVTDGAVVFESGVSTVDGTAVGVGTLAGFLYANTNDGRVVEVNLATGQQTVIASQGSRGDLVTVDPNGSLLVTMTDKVYRLIPPAGGSFGGQTVSVAFYRGDPASGGTKIGTARTAKALAPGEFEDVSVTWTGATAGLHPIVVVADDNGAGLGAVLESDETNNKAGANILLGVGPFPLVDGLLTRFKDKAVDVLWVPVPGAASYNLYRRSGSGSLQLVKDKLTEARFSDAGLTNGTLYSYVVRWVDSTGKESADGTEASAVPTPDVRVASTPPTILSNPLTRARALARYAYQVAAGDPDPGDTLTYSLTTAPAGMTISGAGLLEWTPALAQGGYNNVTVKVQDSTGRFATQTFRLFAEVEIVNNAPVITSAPLTRGASGETYSYRVLARDPDAGDLLTFSLTAAPAGMSINPATGLISWLPTRQQVTTHAVTVRVADLAGLQAEQSFSVVIARGNTAPRFTSLPVTITRAGSTYRYQPSAVDGEGDPLTYGLESVTAGTALGVDAATGAVSWTVPAGAAGTTVDVILRVTDDGGLKATQAYRIAVGAANVAPVITSSAVTTGVANAGYRYVVTATDGNLPEDVLTYSLLIGPAGMTMAPLTGVLDWVPPAAAGGTNVNVSVRVVDQLGLSVTQSFVIAVQPPDLTRPAVSLLAPANGSTLAADAQVTGTVTDDNLRLWRVEYRAVGAANWQVLASGSTNVNAGGLGVFPATLLANDVYRIRLYAEDAVGSVTSPEIEVKVDTKQLKLGDFTLSYEDLRVPAGTFPISVLRKYDTKRREAGDFGPGWTLAFNEVDVRIDVNKNVFLTLPDGRRVGFVYTPTCLSVLFGACLFSAFNTGYTAQSGVYDTLTSLDCPQTIAGTCSFAPFDPKDWLLTTKGGVKYTIRSGKVTRMEDRSGNWQEISPAGITSNSGRSVTFQRDGAGRITAILDPKKNVSRYEYDASGRLAKVTDAAGNPTTYDYLAGGHYITAINVSGGCSPLKVEYGADGRVTAKSDAGGNRFVYSYDLSGRRQTVTNPLGQVQMTEYDERGNVIAESDGAGQKTSYAYDASNNRIVTTFPTGRKVVRTYGVNGNILSESNTPVTGPALVTRYAFNSYSQPESITSPSGEKTLFEYDMFGNVTRREQRSAAGVLVRGDSFTYDSGGKRLAAIDGDGKEIRYTYDSFGSLVSRRDPTGAITRYEYDVSGNPSAVIDATGVRGEFTYNSLNLLAEVRRGGQKIASHEYNDFGKPTKFTDALGRITTFGYSCGGDLIRVTDPSGKVTSYDLDGVQNLRQITDANSRQTRFGFDAVNRPVSRTTPDGGVWRFTWDAEGALTGQSSPSMSPAVSRQFDGYGRASSETVSGATHSYEYDSDGRLVKVNQAGVGTWTFLRDGAGQLTGTTVPQAGRNIEYGYNLRGLRTSMTTPDGWTTRYSYDDAGRVEQISTGSATARFSYDAAGRRTRVVYSNGASSNFSYDAQGRLSGVVIRNGSGSVVSSYAYSMNANGDRTGVVLADGSATYGLDNLNRITSENVSSLSLGTFSKAYSYDAVGNRLEQGGTLGVDYRLLSDGGGSLTYDASGNRTGRGGKIYGYDGLNRLVSFAEGSVTATYQYDYSGRRTSRTVNGVLSEYLYDGDNIAVEYLAGGQTVRYTYGLGVDEILMQTRGSSTYFYHTDALGSIVAITDGAGNAVQRYGYDAWGNLIQNSGTFSFSGAGLTNRFTYSGREWDSESGLYHFRARAYDPQVGRFLQKDPQQGSLSFPASQHPYSYSVNNPLNVSDPSGETAFAEYVALLDGNNLSRAASSLIGGLVGFGVSNLQFLGQFLALGDAGGLTLAQRWQYAVDLTEIELKKIPFLAGQFSVTVAKDPDLKDVPCVDSNVKVSASLGGGLAKSFVSGFEAKVGGETVRFGAKIDLFNEKFPTGSVGASVNGGFKLAGFSCGAQIGVFRLRLMQPK